MSGTRRTEAVAALALMLALAGCSRSGNGPVAAPLPDAQSAGAQLMMRNCTPCHGAPQPTAHTASEWEGVVARMQQRRAAKGFPPIPGEEVAVIMEYLQAHARGG